jgi:multidrug efflux pump subunit AcrA (membrane-fusion protein)
MKNSRLLFLLFSANLLLVLPSCGPPQSEDEEGPAPEATVAVQTAEVTEGNAILGVTAYGKTDALRKEKVYAPLAGKIASLKAFEGTPVHKGDLLAVIQTKESQSAILGAEGMLEAARTPDQKKEAKRMLDLARATQQTVNVLARFDGAVASRAVSEGELVAENGELFTIVDLSTVDFLADVPLNDIAPVKRGQTAVVRFQTFIGKDFPAVVDAINPASDMQSQTVQVRLQFSAMPEPLRSLLRTEMIGTATIHTGLRAHALFVPKAALLRNDENNTYSVMTITPDSLALHVPVEVGVMTDSTAEVQSSRLQKGTTVITVGAYSLADSTHVMVTPSE